MARTTDQPSTATRRNTTTAKPDTDGPLVRRAEPVGRGTCSSATTPNAART